MKLLPLLFPLAPNYLPQHPILEHPRPTFLPQRRTVNLIRLSKVRISNFFSRQFDNPFWRSRPWHMSKAISYRHKIAFTHFHPLDISIIPRTWNITTATKTRCTCVTYEGKSLNNRKFYIRKNFFTRVFTEIVCVLFFDTVPLLRNTLGPPVHKLADAL